jgi:hypothetical protein
MLSHQETSDEEFDELCALAALGKLPRLELAELNAHIAVCISCRIEYSDYLDLVRGELGVGNGDGRRTARVLLPLSTRGYRRRFLDEARRQGFHFSESTLRSRPFWRNIGASSLLRPRPAYAAAAAILLLAGMVAALAYRLRESNIRIESLATQVIEQTGVTRSDDRSARSGSSTMPSEAPEIETPIAEDGPIPKRDGRTVLLEAALSKAQAQNATLLARCNAFGEQLRTASLELESLRTEITTSNSQAGDLAVKLREAEQNLGRMGDDVKSLRDGRATDLSNITVQEARMKELSERLRDQAEALDRQRRLLSADRDIRDLMTARNLHIIDVFDVDGKGKTRKTFGRAFYTEDKSLIFYAFDLDDRRITKADYSLQAWGYQQSTEGSVQSLGIFYVDDQKRNRWALKFDNSEVLAQIDAVFVTVEPAGGSKRPTGERLLYAYLRNTPNHP